MWRVILRIIFIGLCLSTGKEGVAAKGVPVEPGFFGVREKDGRWQLIDPAGRPFFSTGMACVSFEGDTIRGSEAMPYRDAVTTEYGSLEKWRRATAERLQSWGFNTLGGWSDDGLTKIETKGGYLAETPVLNLGAGFAGQSQQESGAAHAWVQGLFPDVFDPNFVSYCREQAEKECLPRRDDPNVLGWFLDNELRWSPDQHVPEELLVTFLNLPPGAPGRKAALDLLRHRYPSIREFNRVWGMELTGWEAAAGTRFATPRAASTHQDYRQNADVDRSPAEGKAKSFYADCDAFLELVARRYFQVTRDAIRTVDRHHLLLGCRFASVPSRPVMATAAEFEDVISFNCYRFNPTTMLDRYASAHRPLLISEFTFRGGDTVCPNTQGAGPVVADQRARAADFERYARAAASHPNLVGYQWFKLADEPREGRFDGENSNYGVVDIQDRPYAVLAERMAKINRRVTAAGR